MPGATGGGSPLCRRRCCFEGDRLDLAFLRLRDLGMACTLLRQVESMSSSCDQVQAGRQYLAMHLPSPCAGNDRRPGLGVLRSAQFLVSDTDLKACNRARGCGSSLPPARRSTQCLTVLGAAPVRCPAISYVSVRSKASSISMTSWLPWPRTGRISVAVRHPMPKGGAAGRIIRAAAPLGLLIRLGSGWRPTPAAGRCPLRGALPELVPDWRSTRPERRLRRRPAWS